jgi:hypothetical protein
MARKAPSGNTNPTAMSPRTPVPLRGPLPADEARELAVRVRTEVAVPLAGTVIEVGLNEQEINPDELEHEKFTLPLKPLTGETVTLKFADPPFDTVALVGATAAV